MITITQLYQSTTQALESHGATVGAVVTTAIALCTRYTGWSPKQLGTRWARVPALVLSCLVYLWVLAGESGLSWLVGATSVVAGLVAGVGSNLAHDGLQAAAKTGTIGKTGIVVALLGAMGAATGCGNVIPPATSPSAEQLTDMCVTVAPYDHEMTKALAEIPEADRAAVLHAACATIANQLLERK